MIPRLARVPMVLAAGLLMGAVLATAQPKDPFVGAWRLTSSRAVEPGPARRK